MSEKSQIWQKTNKQTTCSRSKVNPIQEKFREITPRHIRVKLPKTKNEEKSLENTQRKTIHFQQGKKQLEKQWISH